MIVLVATQVEVNVPVALVKALIDSHPEAVFVERRVKLWREFVRKSLAISLIVDFVFRSRLIFRYARVFNEAVAECVETFLG